MNIPDEAVEAAAEAMWLARPMIRLKDGEPKPWAEIQDSYYRPRYMSQARLALTAAAPFIAAQAWDEGITRGRELAAWALGTQGPEHRPSTDNPYRSEQ